MFFLFWTDNCIAKFARPHTRELCVFTLYCECFTREFPVPMNRSVSLATACVLVQRLCLLLVLFLVPIFFLPWTIDVLEVNKQTLLVALTLVSALAWFGSMIVSRSVGWKRGWLNLLPFLFLVSILASTLSSHAGFLSWVGESGQEYGSLLSFATYVALFYLFANTAGDARFRRDAIAVTLLSAFAAGTIGLLSLLKVYLPFAFAQSQTFNTVGTIDALGVFLSVCVVLAAGLWLIRDRAPELLFTSGGKTAELMLAAAVGIEGMVFLILLDDWVLWVPLLVGLGVLFAIALLRAKDFPNSSRFVFPMLLFVVGFLLLFFPSPFHASIPGEVTPSVPLSWTIASKGFSEGRFWLGSGPGTFDFDYAKLKPVELNTTPYWNVRFDRASSDALTMLATLGAMTLVLLVLFLLVLGGKSLKTVLSAKAEWHVGFAFVGAWATSAVALFTYGSNVTLYAFLFALSGILAAAALQARAPKSFAQSPRLGLLASFLFIVLSVGIVTLLFIAARRYGAEIAFAKAIRMDRAGENIQDVVTDLDRAATANRFNDIYYRNLSQALLVQVGTELGQMKSGQATAEQRSYLQALTAASINAGVNATTLSPDNVLNWISRGAVYRELVPIVDTAGGFAADAFQQAIALEPTNPENQTELGKTYLILAEQERTYTSADDPAVKAEHETKLTDDLAKAEAAFEAAIALKSDYAPAHYQLAVTFEREGRLDDAIGKMESVGKYNPLDVGVAFQLGVLYLRRNKAGDLALAQKQFETALQLVPSYSNAHWFLASVYEQEGNTQGAIDEVQKVLDLNPDNATVKARLDHLKAGETSAEPVLPVDADLPTT